MNIPQAITRALLALSLLPVLQGCGDSFPSDSASPTSATMKDGYNSVALKISEAKLSRDPGGKDVSALFKPFEHTMYVNILLSAPGNGAKVRVVWTQVSNSFLPNVVLYEKEVVVEGDLNGVHVKASYSKDWPVGTYKTDIYLDGKLEKTLDWEVG